MSDEQTDELIQSYLDGAASAAQQADLLRLMGDDPATADAFARAARFESLLEARFLEQTTTVATAEIPAPGVRRPAVVVSLRWVAAAIVLAGSLGLVVWQLGRTNLVVGQHQVVSGRVLVDGIESLTIPNGSRVEVLKAVSIQLVDGSDVYLAPSSTAEFRADAEGSIVKLNYGNGRFRNRDVRRPIRVDTSAGAVSGHDTEFAVELQSTAEAGVTAMSSNIFALLTVAVLTGQVEVEAANEKVQVSAGESRAFSAEKKPMFAGRVADVSSDGKRITLEGKPSKPGTPPPRREVKITAETELVYHGVARTGDRPTVGYAAVATLNRDEPETATIIEFGDKTPHVVGVVKNVADDGRTVALEVYRKNDKPMERSIAIQEQTRVSYTDVDTAGEKPTVGYQASVWLDGDSDKAREVRFLHKSKGAAPPTPVTTPKPTTKPIGSKPNPKSPTKEPLPAAKPVDPKKDDSPTKPVESKKPSEAKSSTVAPPTLKANPKSLTRRASTRDPLPVAAAINREINHRLAEAKIVASPQADDAEFLRRATLDITGQIPTYAATRAFLADADPEKRRKLIDELLFDPTYGRRFGAIWKRLIQPKPASNGKPQVDKVTPWLAEQFNQNRGWDEVVQEFLTTEANLSRDPQGYFLAVNSESFDPKPNLLTAATARLFLGVQLACAECHNHPFAEWKQAEFWSLAAFFSRVHKRSKSDFSLTEETTESVMAAEIAIPEGGKAAGTLVPARFLSGDAPRLDTAQPLRSVLAEWLTADDNPYFARAMVNRLWAHFFGRGLVEPLDGFQAGFVASHPAVLDLLAAEFVASRFDVQHLVRILANTQAYGRTSQPLSENANDAELRSRMAVKVLSPDMLYDSLTIAVNANLVVAGPSKNGKVAQPVPLSIGPRDEFVNFFSGPAVESSAEEYAHGIPQLLRLMNAEAFNVGAPLAKAIASGDGTPEERITTLYLAVLSRRPTDDERRTLTEYVVARQGTEQAYAGALWILLNTSEFVLNR